MHFRKSIVLLCVLITLISWAGCKKKTTDPVDTSLHLIYLEHLNNGCLELEEPAMAPSRDPYLVGHTIEGNDLTLTIHYEANCCPAFVDSIRLMDQTVEILIDDTLQGCRCICDYENDFAFNYSGSGALHLLFGWFNEPFSLDTTIVLP
ncbi:hypothetical protein HQ585_07295 [candidate division KSB1 bacterium]|nr:hypothetical protein [candidate division KSB1 bacterium]